MKAPVISGIQQIGVGNTDVQKTFTWYRQQLGMDIPVFDEAAEAALMLPYTGGQKQSRHAILAINMQGGGGLEIWQYVGRDPVLPKFQIQLGDLGIFAAKFKSADIPAAYKSLKGKQEKMLGEVAEDPARRSNFFMEDLHGNAIQVLPSKVKFSDTKSITGGVFGAIIGCSDIDASMRLYKDVLGYDKIAYDQVGNFADFEVLPGGKGKFRRVLLQESSAREGAFSKLFGPSEIELVQALDREPRKMFEGRFWGDPGYIHLCFDIQGMAALKHKCAEAGFPFTVDSASSPASEDSFDMGEAAGHFTYIEDPDGTLIEFVETHKVPIMKKLGWYLNMRKRDPKKPLPNWMIKAMGFGRVKD